MLYESSYLSHANYKYIEKRPNGRGGWTYIYDKPSGGGMSKEYQEEVAYNSGKSVKTSGKRSSNNKVDPSKMSKEYLEEYLANGGELPKDENEEAREARMEAQQRRMKQIEARRQRIADSKRYRAENDPTRIQRNAPTNSTKAAKFRSVMEESARQVAQNHSDPKHRKTARDLEESYKSDLNKRNPGQTPQSDPNAAKKTRGDTVRQLTDKAMYEASDNPLWKAKRATRKLRKKVKSEARSTKYKAKKAAQETGKKISTAAGNFVTKLKGGK